MLICRLIFRKSSCYTWAIIWGALISSPGKTVRLKGAQRILDHDHTTFENCAAIGDSMNDVELIEAAGFGVAMGNAMPNVQARADYVTADVDHDGLAQAIEAARKHFAD